MNMQAWLQKNTETLRGKRIAVTGSTGGLGMELCTYLASLGASLFLLDRNAARSAAHKESLSKRFGVDVTCVPLDLEDISSADAAVSALLDAQVDSSTMRAHTASRVMRAVPDTIMCTRSILPHRTI